MIPFELNVDNFKTLPFSQRIEKVRLMLSVLKTDENIFNDLYNLFSFMEDVSENFVLTIYESLIKELYSLEKKQMNQALTKLDAIKDKLNSIKNEESQEKKDLDSIMFDF